MRGRGEHTSFGCIPAVWRAAVGAAFLLVVGLAGCAFNRGHVGEPISPEAVSKIERGTTTQTEVLALLGAPERIVRANEHDVLHYYYYDVKSASLLLILVNFSRAHIKSDDLFVFVDREGVVTEVLYGRKTDSLEFRFWPFGD